jgi:hypothetical protein
MTEFSAQLGYHNSDRLSQFKVGGAVDTANFENLRRQGYNVVPQHMYSGGGLHLAVMPELGHYRQGGWIRPYGNHHLGDVRPHVRLGAYTDTPFRDPYHGRPVEPVQAINFGKGGHVKDNGHKMGDVLHVDFKIKDSDTVPAVLTPNEFVLTEKMRKLARGAFKKAKVRPIKGL